MPETLNVRFDSADLPAWAQYHAAVVRRCRTNLEYRVDVCRAETVQRQRHLVQLAERLERELSSR